MFEIKHSIGAVVASDTQNLCASIDMALLDSSSLIASVIEGSADSKLPISVSQKLLQSAAASVSHLVSGRAELANTVAELARIQCRSSLSETNFGCPESPPMAQGFLNDTPCASQQLKAERQTVT